MQKLLYFIQANFLFELGINSPCFNNEIIALPYGPVVQEVLDKYKGSNRNPLKVDAKIDDINNKKYVDEILEYFEDTPASYLVDITHKQTPWKEAYSKGVGEVITKNAILNYFKEVSKVLKND